MKKDAIIFITGVAGFIGFHFAIQCLKNNQMVIGIDNFNDYYDISIKRSRYQQLIAYPNFVGYEADLLSDTLSTILIEHADITHIVHLAAQAGVRYSLEQPQTYIDNNIQAFFILLEQSKKLNKLEHFLYASSSSVYGLNTDFPFNEQQACEQPNNLYAVTKKTNELFAHAYAANYQIPCTGLRFFTVYGSWGRPDMALFLFTQGILNQTPISIHNHGKHARNFTHITDVVTPLYQLLNIPPREKIPYRVVNIASSEQTNLMAFLELIEDTLNKKGIYNYLPLQTGDIPTTQASLDTLQTLTQYSPQISLKTGIKDFVDWYKVYYNIP